MTPLQIAIAGLKYPQGTRSCSLQHRAVGALSKLHVREPQMSVPAQPFDAHVTFDVPAFTDAIAGCSCRGRLDIP